MLAILRSPTKDKKSQLGVGEMHKSARFDSSPGLFVA